MIIDQLPLLQGNPIDDDEFPVERGTTTYKTKLLALAAAVLGKLVKDATPAEDSANPVESGGVYAALQTKQDQIIDSGILKGNGSSVSAATLGADYTAVDDTLESSAAKTYSIDKIKSLEPTGLVSYAEAQSLAETEQSQARDNISAAREWTTVWTNASPSSSFAAQTVTLDLSGCTEIGIQIRMNVSSSTVYDWRYFSIGTSSFVRQLLNDGKNLMQRYRSVNTASNGVTFGDSTDVTQGSNGVTNNSGNIPEIIIAR